MPIVLSVEIAKTRSCLIVFQVLPFSCPLGATTSGKRAQSATRGESENRAIFIGRSLRSGNLTQRAAKGG